MVCELWGVRADVQFMKRMRGARVWLLKIRHTSKFISRICKFYQISHRWTRDWTGSNVVINSIVAEARPEKHWLLLLSSHHHHSRRLKTRKWCDKLLFTLLQAHSQNNPASNILSSSSFNISSIPWVHLPVTMTCIIYEFPAPWYFLCLLRPRVNNGPIRFLPLLEKSLIKTKRLWFITYSIASNSGRGQLRLRAGNARNKTESGASYQGNKSLDGEWVCGSLFSCLWCPSPCLMRQMSLSPQWSGDTRATRRVRRTRRGSESFNLNIQL